MKVYKYASGTQVEMLALKALQDRLHGSSVAAVLASENPAYPGFYLPIGKGSEAPPTNVGCNLIEAIRVSILGGLGDFTAAERIQFSDADTLAEEYEHSFWWPIEEE
jgi:hypothetical protein